MAMNPELQTKMAAWRQKAVDNTLTIEDMREAINMLRAGRKSAAVASESSRRTKARKVVKTADEMLSELEGIGK